MCVCRYFNEIRVLFNEKCRFFFFWITVENGRLKRRRKGTILVCKEWISHVSLILTNDHHHHGWFYSKTAVNAPSVPTLTLHTTIFELLFSNRLSPNHQSTFVIIRIVQNVHIWKLWREKKSLHTLSISLGKSIPRKNVWKLQKFAIIIFPQN